MKFQEMVTKELLKAKEKHAPINSLHEGYAVILEEVDEFWEEVRKKTSERNKEDVISELVQIAAMCQRLYEDVVE